jgi:50S ribosomal protein L16 3-hydroxylase
LLLRQAIDPERLQLPADELAGLACEEGVESRLIRQAGETDWVLQHGPLAEDVFATLPDSRWTLLVQDVDKFIPEVADLLDAFDFLPDWRIDDIMISYAVDQGGVGPHTDNYDVFLVQAQGRRRWRLSDRDYDHAQLLPDCPLRVLREFHTSEDWILEPGDVLYLPPRVAHWGTAEGECVTWSVGMRGPSQAELLEAWLDHLAERASPRHFHDAMAPGRRPPSGITATELDTARRLMLELMPRDDDVFRRWFGEFVTEPKPGFEVMPPQDRLSPDELRTAVAGGMPLRRHPWARFACIRLLDDRGAALCAQGACFDASPALAPAVELLATQRRLAPAQLLCLPQQEMLWPWLEVLYSRGLLLADG